jgi:hypothetical protein
MIAPLSLLLAILASPFRSKIRLVAENALLRHQALVMRRKVKVRVPLTNGDRWLFVQLYRWFPSILSVLAVIQPETLVRWHQAGFRLYWRCKSRSRGGRTQIDAEVRALIRRISIESPLWGAPRIHGEPLKLGFGIAQSSVAKYMVKRAGPPSQGTLFGDLGFLTRLTDRSALRNQHINLKKLGDNLDPDPTNWSMLSAIFSGILNLAEEGCHEAQTVFGRADSFCLEAS